MLYFFVSLDFVEEEITDALQKDSDPSLADSSSLSCNPDPHELFFPLQIGSEAEEMLFSNKPYASATPIPEEILDFDQGVAMESDHQPQYSSVFSDCDVSFDLPFSSPPPTTTASPLDTMDSSNFIPSTTTSNYSHVTNMVDQLNLITPTSITTERQNSELDFICSVLQSETEQPNTTYSNGYNSNISIDTTNGMELINLLNSSVPQDSYDFNGFPVSMMLGKEQNNVLPPCDNGTGIHLTLNGISQMASHMTTGGGCSSDGSSYAGDTRHSSPIPSPLSMVPSPVSSVTTETSESDYDKNGNRSARQQDRHSTKKKIVSMPFYEFKKILDSPIVSERDKEQVKAIRKRGKNKVAAKHCRERKMEIVMGLQQEVEKLRGFKAQLVMKSLSLQRKIEEDKKTVSRYCQNISHTPTPPRIVH